MECSLRARSFWMFFFFDKGVNSSHRGVWRDPSTGCLLPICLAGVESDMIRCSRWFFWTSHRRMWHVVTIVFLLQALIWHQVMMVAGRSKNSSHREVLNVGPAMCYLLRCRHKHSKSFSEHMESILLCSNSFFHPNAVLNCPGLYVVAIDIFLYNKNILLIIMFEPDSWSYMCADASFLRFMVTKRAIRCHTVGCQEYSSASPNMLWKGSNERVLWVKLLKFMET